MEIVVQVIIVILSAIFGAGASWAIGRKQANREAAIAYLGLVCSALEGMIEDFRARAIPHRSGHAFIGVLDAFTGNMKPHIRGDIEGHIHKLRSLAEEAQKIDFNLYQGRESQEIEYWIVDAERVLGDLQAEAAKIKGKQ